MNRRTPIHTFTGAIPKASNTELTSQTKSTKLDLGLIYSYHCQTKAVIIADQASGK